MSPLKRTGKKDEVKLAFATSPGKKGSGYGYGISFCNILITLLVNKIGIAKN